MTQYNASERKDVRRLEKAAKVADAARKDMMVGVMSTIAGRAWILEKLESASVFRTTFNTDSLAMAFAEGNRNQGLILLNDIMQHCPDMYLLMMQERNSLDAKPKPEVHAEELDDDRLDSDTDTARE
jgi:hypothetical protein